MAQYDLTLTVIKFLDRHMVLPLLEHLQEKKVRPAHLHPHNTLFITPPNDPYKQAGQKNNFARFKRSLHPACSHFRTHVTVPTIFLLTFLLPLADVQEAGLVGCKGRPGQQDENGGFRS